MVFKCLPGPEFTYSCQAIWDGRSSGCSAHDDREEEVYLPAGVCGERALTDEHKLFSDSAASTASSAELYEGRRIAVGRQVPVPKGDDAPFNVTCVSTAVQYTDEDGDTLCYRLEPSLSARGNPGHTKALVVRQQIPSLVKLYVNDMLIHVVSAVDYNASEGTIWTRPYVRCGDGKRWLGGKISEERRESVVDQLYSFAMKTEKIQWFGDIPVIAEVMVAPVANDIWLHVYDLGEFGGVLNDTILEKFRLGMYHVGVEVFGVEYCFEDLNGTSGIFKCKPKTNTHNNYRYKESTHMGRARMGKREIEQLVEFLCGVWRSDSYHLTHRNCLTFAGIFSKAIGATSDIPLWITNACEVCTNSKVLDFITDRVALLSKWWIRGNRQTRRRKVLEQNKVDETPPEVKKRETTLQLPKSEEQLKNFSSIEHPIWGALAQNPQGKQEQKYRQGNQEEFQSLQEALEDEMKQLHLEMDQLDLAVTSDLQRKDGSSPSFVEL